MTPELPAWTHSDHLLVVLVALPLAAAIVTLVRERLASQATMLVVVLLTVTSLLVGRRTLLGPWAYELGGWGLPLGIIWRVDGLSALLLMLTALLGLAGALYQRSWLIAEAIAAPLAARAARYFWPLWLLLLAALNALLLAGDLFNIYVCLEFLALSGVALVVLNGGYHALAAAMRYLFATLLGSMLYLLGVALLYGGYGLLDITAVAQRLGPDVASVPAAALITIGLLLKAAMFPLHFWLPAAHSQAPAAVSAMLSGMVVAAAFYLLVRLWLGPFAPLINGATAMLLGLLGAAAILWGGAQALRQQRLKLLIGYSTVSQLGFGMLLFPLGRTAVLPERAWTGALVLVFAHGLAKGALFLAAGCIVRHCGHDRIARLRGAAALPLPWLAFALATASLIGLPPSGGFAGKWLLLQAALGAGAWFWALVILAGTLLTAAYLLRVLEYAFYPSAGRVGAPPAIGMQLAALLPALLAALLGLFLLPLEALLAVGAPLAGGGA